MATNRLRPDIAAAVAAMKGSKLGSNREIRKLQDYLAEDEKVLSVAAGRYANGQGLLTLTDRRLFFLKDGVMTKTSEDFPFARVTTVGWRSGILQGTIVIFASGNESKIEAVFKQDGKALVDAARSIMGAPQPSPASHPSTPPTVSAGCHKPAQAAWRTPRLRGHYC